MPPKNKHLFLLLQEQEKAIQDFLENIADEEIPFNNDVSLERSGVDEEIPAPIFERESEGEKGNEEYEQIPRKKIFKTFL